MRFRLRHSRDHHPAPQARSARPSLGRDPAARGARTERGGVERSALGRFERAAARFNASETGRTVTGLVRTLGVPSASVGASAGSADVVRITVAWELSWYQWGVDLGDEARPVFEIGKGYEVAEIDPPARQWNASVVEGGRIVVGTPGPRPVGEDPVRR